MLSQDDFHKMQICSSIENNQRARVYFKFNRLPMFGMFVQLSDSKELQSKGFARFVSASKIDIFNESTDIKKTNFTCLFLISDIKAINLFVCNQLI